MADVINSYETVIVTTAKNGEEASQAIVERFKKFISESATFESAEDWGKRKFAYLIDKQSEGYYSLINFKAAPDFAAELDRRYRITDGVMRSIIVKKDPRYLNRPAKAEKPADVDVEAIAAE